MQHVKQEGENSDHEYKDYSWFNWRCQCFNICNIRLPCTILAMNGLSLWANSDSNTLVLCHHTPQQLNPNSEIFLQKNHHYVKVLVCQANLWIAEKLECQIVHGKNIANTCKSLFQHGCKNISKPYIFCQSTCVGIALHQKDVMKTPPCTIMLSFWSWYARKRACCVSCMSSIPVVMV